MAALTGRVDVSLERSPEDALRIVRDCVAALAPEQVAIERALGCALAQDVHAGAALPAFDNAAMDGYAVRGEDVAEPGARLAVAGESRAGAPFSGVLGIRQAVAISTGGLLPEGADTVVRVELCSRDGDGVVVSESVVSGRDVRQAGTELAAGELVLTRGTRLGPAGLGLLAAMGAPQVLCVRRPRVCLLVTGDELRARDAVDEFVRGEIWDSNSAALGAFAEWAGAEEVRRTRVADDPGQLREALTAGLRDVDMLVTSGGMSVGAHDHVRDLLRELGVQEHVHRLAMRPGGPTYFGSRDGVPVLGLAGNPVAALTGFALLGVPALRALQGLQASSALGAVAEYEGPTPTRRLDLVHARFCDVRQGQDGLLHAVPTRTDRGRGLMAAAAANAICLIRPGRGATVDVVWLPFSA